MELELEESVSVPVTDDWLEKRHKDYYNSSKGIRIF